MFEEMRGDITIGGWEEGGRSTPSGRIRLLCSDICRDGRPEKAPYSDSSVIPQMGENATSKKVEFVPVAPGVGIGKATTTVIGSAASAQVVDNLGQRALFVELRPNFAACRGMKGIRIGLLIVDAFQNVDLSCSKY
jgi:hypothetical protein